MSSTQSSKPGSPTDPEGRRTQENSGARPGAVAGSAQFAQRGETRNARAAPPGAGLTGVATDQRGAGPELVAVTPIPANPASPSAAQPGDTIKALPSRPATPGPAAPRPRSPIVIRPPAALAKQRPRHLLVVASFAVVVLLPILVAAAYLWGKAADQYASTLGFSVRREDSAAALDVLGGLTALSKSSSSDTDILYEYLRSQKLVADMDAKLDLRSIWSKPVGDPVFAFDPSGSIEDLLDYWQDMVRTSYDSATGLIEVRVLAFDPDDATRIAETLLAESSRMINDLSAAAREDAVRFSREELDVAEDRLRTTREAVTAFRIKNQIVDPTTDFQTQAGLVGTLENQLAEAQIEIDLLADVPEANPRLVQAQRRVEVIEARLAAERAKVGNNAAQSGRDDYAALAGEFERLAVDREFAEKAYVAALAAYDSAKAESQRTSRYLAAHVMPTRAEVSRYPERLSILGLLALGLLLLWSIGTLVAYSLKDRR